MKIHKHIYAVSTSFSSRVIEHDIEQYSACVHRRNSRHGRYVRANYILKTSSNMSDFHGDPFRCDYLLSVSWTILFV